MGAGEEREQGFGVHSRLVRVQVAEGMHCSVLFCSGHGDQELGICTAMAAHFFTVRCVRFIELSPKVQMSWILVLLSVEPLHVGAFHLPATMVEPLMLLSTWAERPKSIVSIAIGFILAGIATGFVLFRLEVGKRS